MASKCLPGQQSDAISMACCVLVWLALPGVAPSALWMLADSSLGSMHGDVASVSTMHIGICHTDVLAAHSHQFRVRCW